MVITGYASLLGNRPSTIRLGGLQICTTQSDMPLGNHSHAFLGSHRFRLPAVFVSHWHCAYLFLSRADTWRYSLTTQQCVGDRFTNQK